MKIKILLTVFLLLFCLSFATAQSHKVGEANYNCKLNKKGWFFNSEKYDCPACKVKDDKEKNAREAEDKRRMDAHNAKVFADRKAAEALIQEKLRLAKEEELRIKNKEIADKIARDAALKRYREIASKGLVKSNVKGQAPDIDLSLINSFSDDKRKIFGFKINDEEVMTFPYDSQAMNIRRIEGSNLYVVDVWKTPNKYWYSYVIDYTGRRIKTDNIDHSDFMIGVDPENKVMYYFKNISKEVIDDMASLSNEGLNNFHTTKESAIADVESYERPGWDMRRKEVICYDTRYTFDFTGNYLEKADGYVIRVD